MSELPGFYKKSLKERLEIIAEKRNLSTEEVKLLLKEGPLSLDKADNMIENVIGTHPLPVGIAVNFRVNNKDYLIPMAVEEPSVIAAACNSAKVARDTGGFYTSNTGPFMFGQIQAVNVADPTAAKFRILEKKEEIIKLANNQDPILVKFGGGCKDVRVKTIDTILGTMVITELIVDCRDAMGANAVNTMAEAVSPLIEDITGGKNYLRIISNLADKRLVRARAVFPKEKIGGEEVVDGVITAYAFAEADPYRCATHNKGIMNGIDAVVVATGNDWRAIEAGVHTYAARTGFYQPLSTWEKDENGDLVGTIELPMAVGLIGGATKTHPVAQIAIKILGVESATELGEVIASVGLAQNFGALRALATVGIQKGHMKLHARNIANAVGATDDLAEKIAKKMIEDKKIRFDYAQELYEKMK